MHWMAWPEAPFTRLSMAQTATSTPAAAAGSEPLWADLAGQIPQVGWLLTMAWLVTVEREGMLHPFRGVFDGPYVDAVKRAVKAGFGKEPAFIREGGSIGAVVTMQKAWKVPILFMGLSLPEHGYHAPNEYFDWGQASGGMKAFVHYFAELAAKR